MNQNKAVSECSHKLNCHLLIKSINERTPVGMWVPITELELQ